MPESISPVTAYINMDAGPEEIRSRLIDFVHAKNRERPEQKTSLRWQKFVDSNTLRVTVPLRDHSDPTRSTDRTFSLVQNPDVTGLQFIGGQADNARAQRRISQAKNLATARFTFQFVVVTGVVGSVVLGRVFRIEVPIVGGSMTAAKWGALAGVTFSYLAPVGAIAWVVLAANRMRAIGMLLTLGSISFIGHSVVAIGISLWAEQLQKRALYEDLQIEKVRKVWVDVSHSLMDDLHKALEDGDDRALERLYDQATKLHNALAPQDDSEHPPPLSCIYLQAPEMYSYLLPVCQRIMNARNEIRQMQDPSGSSTIQLSTLRTADRAYEQFIASHRVEGATGSPKRHKQGVDSYEHRRARLKLVREEKCRQITEIQKRPSAAPEALNPDLVKLQTEVGRLKEQIESLERAETTRKKAEKEISQAVQALRKLLERSDTTELEAIGHQLDKRLPSPGYLLAQQQLMRNPQTPQRGTQPSSIGSEVAQMEDRERAISQTRQAISQLIDRIAQQLPQYHHVTTAPSEALFASIEGTIRALQETSHPLVTDIVIASLDSIKRGMAQKASDTSPNAVLTEMKGKVEGLLIEWEEKLALLTIRPTNQLTSHNFLQEMLNREQQLTQQLDAYEFEKLLHSKIASDFQELHRELDLRLTALQWFISGLSSGNQEDWQTVIAYKLAVQARIDEADQLCRTIEGQDRVYRLNLAQTLVDEKQLRLAVLLAYVAHHQGWQEWDSVLGNPNSRRAQFLPGDLVDGVMRPQAFRDQVFERVGFSNILFADEKRTNPRAAAEFDRGLVEGVEAPNWLAILYIDCYRFWRAKNFSQ